MNSPGRRSVWERLDSLLFGSVFSLRQANKKVLLSIAADSEENYARDTRLAHSIDDIRATRDFAIERLERVEDKARSTVLGVGIAVTVVGSACTLLGQDGPLSHVDTPVRVGFGVAFSLAVIFLLASGYLALRAFSIGQVWIPTLDDSPPLAGEKRAKRIELFYSTQNIRVGTVRGNYMSASFDCLRNGIALLGLLAVAVLLISALQIQDQTETQQPVSPPCAHRHWKH